MFDCDSRAFLRFLDRRGGAFFRFLRYSGGLGFSLADELRGAFIDGDTFCAGIRELALQLDEPLTFAGEPFFYIAEIFGEGAQICFELQAAIFCGGPRSSGARCCLHSLRIDRRHVPQYRYCRRALP